MQNVNMYHHPIYPNPASYFSWTIPMYPKWKCFPCFYVCPKSVIPQMVLLKNDRFCHYRHKSLQWFPSSLKKIKNKRKQNYPPHQKISPSYTCFPLTSLIPSSTHAVLFAWLQLYLSLQFSQSLQSFSHVFVTLCDSMNRSTPGLPVHHQLPESTQTHVHRVGNAIQPSHPLSSPSPAVPNPSQHQGLFQRVNSSHEVAKVLEFQLQHQSFQWTPRTDLL